MSLTRSFFNEFRPLFRMLEEPLAASRAPRDTFYASPFRSFLGGQDLFRSAPSLELHEQGNNYVLETELPGYKKEDVDIRIGDDGQSVTISGRNSRRSRFSDASADQTTAVTPADATPAQAETSQAVTGKQDDGQVIGKGANLVVVEPNNNTSVQQAAPADFSEAYSTFRRTVWLPQPTNRDGSNVTAQLADGILTLTIPKAEQQAPSDGVKVMIQ
jgi:HSP20 family protein